METKIFIFVELKLEGANMEPGPVPFGTTMPATCNTSALSHALLTNQSCSACAYEGRFTNVQVIPSIAQDGTKVRIESSEHATNMQSTSEWIVACVAPDAY